jgi:hypothetical protein
MASLQSRQPPWQTDLALAALDATVGADRQWAEGVLLSYLHAEPRAAGALAHLGSARAVAPLRELSTVGSGELRVGASAALATLTRR